MNNKRKNGSEEGLQIELDENIKEDIQNEKINFTDDKIEIEDIDDKYSKNKKRIFDDKSQTFFEKICNKAFVDLIDTDLDQTAQNSDIHYGNQTNNYDPKNSITNIQKTSLLCQSENNFDSNLMSHNLLNILKKADLQPKKFRNIQNLNLGKKECLLYLIERNRKNNIYCPFDEIAFYKIHNFDTGIKLEPRDVLVKVQEFCNYEPNSIMNLMPNCIATFLLQFFFDIFQPSELKSINKKTLDIMLKLKNRLNPESYVDTNFINMHIVENVIWNCFALYKYRFNSTYKIGFLNYLISLDCFMEILENSDKKAKISKILPFYIEALVLNGFLKHKDLESLQLDESKNYVRKFMSYSDGVNSEVPKLKNICRLFIKNRLVNFDRITIDKLSLDDENKNFLLFDHEFQNLFAQNEINL